MCNEQKFESIRCLMRLSLINVHLTQIKDDTNDLIQFLLINLHFTQIRGNYFF